MPFSFLLFCCGNFVYKIMIKKTAQQITEKDIKELIDVLNASPPKNSKWIIFCEACRYIHLFDEKTELKCRKATIEPMRKLL